MADDKWELPILVKVDAKGKEAYWKISFDGVNRLVMEHGKIGGKMITSSTVITPKCKRTMQEQAYQEACHRYDDKIRKNNYHQQGERTPDTSIPSPMLAQSWCQEKMVLQYPLYVQPKLDGIRMLARRVKGEVVVESRNKKAFYFLDHITQGLDSFFDSLPEGTIIDGELYSPHLTFSEIASIARSSKNKKDNTAELEYHIFDLVTPNHSLIFGKRLELLTQVRHSSPSICVVETQVVDSFQELLASFSSYTQKGYEGLIIRKNSVYVFGRTTNILKYKEFQDEEATIVGFKDAKGTEEGAIIFVVEDVRGNHFPVRPRATLDKRKEWLDNNKELIGKTITIRFQELTEKNVPRFPVGVEIRDYE